MAKKNAASKVTARIKKMKKKLGIQAAKRMGAARKKDVDKKTKQKIKAIKKQG